MEPREIRVSFALSSYAINKTRHKGEQENWNNVSLPLGELIDWVQQGLPFSPSLFKGGYRNAENAHGGNLVVIDADDGTNPAVIAELPVFKEWGVAIIPSSSSGVVADKEGVDGRYRCRVIFRLPRDIKTGAVIESFPRERHVIHLERYAVTEQIEQRYCKEAGLAELQDGCGGTIGQLMYGNDGKTPIEVTEKQHDGSYKVVLTYPCSTHDYLYLNDGCMSEEQMAEAIAEYKQSKPERLQPKPKRTSKEAADDYQLALWLLENDVFSEETLVTYDRWYSIGMACKGIDPELMEPFLETSSRFSHLKARMSWEDMEANWERFSDESSYGIGTLIHHADEDTNTEWRYTCPFFGSKQVKQKLSRVYHLLRSHDSSIKGYNNNKTLEDF